MGNPQQQSPLEPVTQTGRRAGRGLIPPTPKRWLIGLTSLLALLVIAFILHSQNARAQAVPSITLTPNTGPPQTTFVQAIGANFATSSIFSVTYDGTSVGSVNTTAGSGSWVLSFSVPISAGGNHTVQAGTTTATFVVTSAITVSAATGSAGSSLTITGMGFGASQTGIAITFGSTQIANVSASTVGSFNAFVTVPFVAAGVYNITVGSAPTQTFTVTSGLSISPISGPAGTTVSIIGGGFAASTSLSLTLDGASVQTVNTDGQGSLNATYQIPRIRGGSHTFGISGAALGGTVPTFTVTPSMVLDRSSAAPGATVTVIGSGFSSSEIGITVTFDGSPVVSAISADSEGRWSGTFQVPVASAGSHVVRASGSLTLGTSVPQATLSISSGLRLDRTSGPPGTSVVVSGFGFNANAAGVTLVLGTNAGLAVVVNEQGLWTATVPIPVSPGGPLLFRVIGPGVQPVEASFTVTPAITLATPRGPPGSTVKVDGSGFSANQTNITVTLGTATGTTTGDAFGSWSVTLTVPRIASGTYQVRTGGSAPAVESAFIVTPAIAVSVERGVPGTPVTVTGSGFSANQSGINVTIGQATVASNVTGAADGTWSTLITVPSLPSGSYPVRTGGSAPVVEVAFGVTPVVSVLPEVAPPGTSVTVTGAGFAASERGISITFGQATLASGIIADAQGSWVATFAAPSFAANTYQVLASGSLSQGSSVRNGTFTITSRITLSPPAAVPGASVSVSGSGFKSSERGIAITFDGSSIVSGIAADGSGLFQSSFVVPVSAGGTHTIKASSGDASVGSSPDATFRTTPNITLNRATGPVAGAVTVSGVGFGANEGGIVISFNSAPVLQNVRADANGSFSVTVLPPPLPVGTHSIQATGAGGAAAIAARPEQAFQITPSLALSPPGGNIGMTTFVIGNGFAPLSPIAVTYSDGLAQATGESDPTGSFRVSLVIPKSLRGDQPIAARDARGNGAQAAFAVDSSPPAKTTLAEPSSGSGGARLKGYRPEFKWSASNDPSGVTYTLEVAKSSDFANPTLVKKELATPSYKLNKEDALARGSYYWRVRAIDAASNEGPWSEPFTVQSGTTSYVLLSVLALLVFAVVGGGTFYVFRRRKVKMQPIPVPSLPTYRELPADPSATTALPAPAKRPALDVPKRLALPDPGRRGLSLEDRAQMQRMMEFVRSIPLLRISSDLLWLEEIVEHTGTSGEDAFESAIFGRLRVRYEPQWIRHPTFNDLQRMLQGNPYLRGLNEYLAAIDWCAMETLTLLREVYDELGTALPPETPKEIKRRLTLAAGRDAIAWFQGTFLRAATTKDYLVKPSETSADAQGIALFGGDETPFAGLLADGISEADAAQYQSTHIQARAKFRASERARELAHRFTEMDVLRERLTKAASEAGQ